MEISNPRLNDRIYVGFIDQTHTGFTDRTRAGLKAGMPFADITCVALSIPGGKRTVVPESNAPSEPGTHITH
jgi:hypothetical protein